MSYIPSEWSDGDAVTSAKLNHLESGVTAVGYEPTTWKAGDVVTAEKLNHLEQGVADSADVIIDWVQGAFEEFTITPEMNGALKNPDEHEPAKYFSIGDNYRLTFNGCSNLKKVNGLELITYDVDSGAFTQTAITDLRLPNAIYLEAGFAAGSAVKYLSCDKVTQTESSALSGGRLEYIYLPSVKVMKDSFQGDQYLKHVYIGKNCTAIGSNCFIGSGGQSTGLIIDCGFAEGAVSGAPWGAANATINYNVPDPGSIDAMIEGE